MKSFTTFITEAISSQTVAKPNPSDDEADMTVAFGRFNPPTTGHERLMNKVKQVAGKGNYEIYPSRSNDPAKNPLDPDTKIGYMQQMFPNHAKHIMNNPKTRTIFDALKGANERGAKSVSVAATHGIFSDESVEKLQDTPIEEIVVTDTLKQNGNIEKIGNVNILSVSSIIATALTSIFADDSVSAIFMGENVL